MTKRRLQDHPRYPWAKELQRRRGRALLRRYGAHGLDIDWVDEPEGPVPGLVFHLSEARSREEGVAIPAAFEVILEDGRVGRVPTRVEVSEPPVFE